MLLIRKVAKHVFEKINVPENERNKELTEDELTKVERP
jgi:ribosomal protein S13